MTAAVLSQRDMPAGYLPAEDQPVFGGLRPSDPDCAELFALADVRGLRDVPQAHAAFYREDPGASLAEHVLRLPPSGAARHIAEARRAAQGCARLKVDSGDDVMRLTRTAIKRPNAKDSFAVRYAARQGGADLYFDVVMARLGDDLLVVGHPGATTAKGKNRLTEKVVARALEKLRAMPTTVTASPKP